MQKARSHPSEERLLPLVGTRFQDLFHSPPGVLFTFPSRYCFTIGHGRVCSLGGWSPRIPTGFPVSRRTQVPELIRRGSPFAYGALTLYGRPFQVTSTRCLGGRATAPSRPYNPGAHAPRFGLLPFRSPLLGESRLISFPGAT
jgi:hypothetical protein